MRVRWLVGLGLLAMLLLAPVAAAGSGPLGFGRPLRVDHAGQYIGPRAWPLNSLSCPAAGLCVGVGDSGQVETSLDPASPSSWSGREISPHAALEGVSCPSVALCVAVTVRGGVLTSVAPRSGAWTLKAGVITGGGVTGGISCPTVSLCVAVSGGSTIATSTDPQHGAWQMIKLPGSLQLDSVSCPSASLCVIADFDGHVVTSTDPPGGTPAWQITDLSAHRPRPGDPQSVSCGSVNECVIGDDGGDLITTSRPTAGASAWMVRPVDSNDSMMVVSCVASLQCVAADDGGNVLSSTDPAAGVRWQTNTDVDPSGIYSLTCQSAALCVAGDGDGSLTSSSDLGQSWTIGPQLGQGAAQPAAFVGLSCPRVSLCVAVDSAGNQFTSVDPAGGKWTARTINPGLDPSALSCTRGGFCEAVGQNSTVAATPAVLRAGTSWRLADLSRYPPGNAHSPSDEALNGVSCVSPALCVATRFDRASNFNLEVSHDPGGPPTGWHAVAIGQPINDYFAAVSCAGAKLCVAADAYGSTLAISTDAAARWHLTRIHGAGTGIRGVSCPSPSFCAVVTNSGRVIASTAPAAGPSAWHGAAIDPGHALDAIACASRSMCTAFDGRGHAFVSSRPAGGPDTWRTTATGQKLTAVACPSVRLCVLTTSDGTVVIGRATHPRSHRQAGQIHRPRLVPHQRRRGELAPDFVPLPGR